jgi:hypothetical protein
MSFIPITKKQALLMMAVPICCMGMLCFALQVSVPHITALFDKMDLLNKLPAPTLFILATYKMWISVPLVAAVAVADFARRPNPGAKHMVVLLMIVLVTALFMASAIIGGLYQPLVNLQLRSHG